MSEERIGDVQSQSHMANTRAGHGFVLKDQQGRPICAITYATREDAEAAHKAIAEWIARAAEVASI